MTKKTSVKPYRMDYESFLLSKQISARPTGFDVQDEAINPKLFPFQRAVVRWAVHRGSAAVFATTGLGKTAIQLCYADMMLKATGTARALILAPLNVARQTVREGHKFGYDVHYIRHGSEAVGGINITNYEMADYFDASEFSILICDESSLLKALDGKTRKKLTEQFAGTLYKLCCTATPAPNDITEIANHAEFLGVMTRAHMLARFFVHDGDHSTSWRLKGHARTDFYRWMASWAMSLNWPSDLGFEDDGFILPPLEIKPLWVNSDYHPDGQLIFTGLHGIQDRIAVRRETLSARVEAAAKLVNETPGQWLVWCGLNEESSALARAIPDAAEVVGSDEPDAKASAIEDFQEGRTRVLVTKGKIAGFGLNLQTCHQMAFVGLSDSYELYFQCIRRCYRFGQTEPVTAHIVLSTIEEGIYQNVTRKESEAMAMSKQLVAAVSDFERAEIGAVKPKTFEYRTEDVSGENWRLMLGDSCDRLKELESESVGLSVFSPPFQGLYVYSPTPRDVGNSNTPEEFASHFGFIADELLRVTKPGRNCCVHVAQVPAMLVRDGYIGLKDFRGDVIRLFQERGWVYHGEVCIDKDPQAQAIRTKSKSLLFVQVHKDASWSRPALADYILIFRKPGDNAEPVLPDITNNEWIEWARPIWYGIRESDTLQYTTAREADDERHIAPLQLGTIERCIRLWSNKGDTVLDPFCGIGSSGYEAIRLGRRYLGIELKPSYYRVAVRNLQEAEAQTHALTLFDITSEPVNTDAKESDNELAA